jgi:type IV pilus assembly protein PilM
MRALSLIQDGKALKIAVVRKDKKTFIIESLKTAATQDDVKQLYSMISTGERPVDLIVTALDAWDVLFRQLHLPIGNKGKAMAALPFQLEPLLPYPPEETILAPLLKKTGKQSMSATIFASKESFLHKHLEWAKAFEIDPDIVAYTPFALYRIGQWLFPQEKNGSLFYWGQEKSFALCLHAGEIHLIQTLHFGLKDLIEALSQDLPEKEEKELQELMQNPNFFAENEERLSHFSEFKRKVGRDLERFAVYLKNKREGNEEGPWLLLGDIPSCFPLIQMWQELISSLLLYPNNLKNWLGIEKVELNQFQNSNLHANSRFLNKIQSLCKSPTLIQICQFAKKLNPLKNHRMWPLKQVLQPALTPSFSDLQSYALPIGLSLHALIEDDHRIQFRQGKWVPVHQQQRKKRLASLYGALCIALSCIIGISGQVIFKAKERILVEKLHALLPPGMIQEELLSAEEIRNQIWKWEKSLSPQKLSFPFLPTTPSVSDVLAWLSTHPVLTAADGGKKEGFEIKSLRYQMYKYPKLGESKDLYQAKVDLEFTANSPRLAREFHDALLKGDSIVDSKREIKWNAQNNAYFTSFELKAIKKGVS